jgi:hypothetical protein
VAGKKQTIGLCPSYFYHTVCRPGFTVKIYFDAMILRCGFRDVPVRT